MRTALKWLLIAFGALLSLAVAAIVIFAVTFDVNDYRDRLTALIQERTGRTLRFNGPLSMTYFPRLGVDMADVELSNAKGFADVPMVQAASVRVNVQVKPLFQGEMKFGRLEVDGLAVHLERAADGSANWDDIVKRLAGSEPAAPMEPQTYSMDIEGMTLTSASVTWDDRQSDVVATATDIHFSSGFIRGGVPTPVELRLGYAVSRPELEGGATLAGTAFSDASFSRVVLRGLDLDLVVQGGTVPGGGADLEATAAEVELDRAADALRFVEAALRVYGASVGASGSVQGLTAGVGSVEAEVRLDEVDLRAVLAEMGIQGPTMADPEALTRVDGAARVAWTPQRVAVADAALEVDQTHVKGEARYDMDPVAPLTFARLTFDQIDLDRYLPLEDTTAAGGLQADNATAADSDDRFYDPAQLQRLNLDLAASVSTMRLRGVRADDVEIGVAAKHGVLRINPFTAHIAEGDLSAGLTVNAMFAKPRTDLIVGVDKMNVSLLAEQFLADASYQGTLDVNGALSSEGASAAQLLQGLDGKVSFLLADGVFPGVDLKRLASETKASKDRKDGRVEAVEDDRTRFGSVSGTAVIADGLLANDDLEVKAPGLRADGEGTVNLVDGVIRYLVRVKLVASREGQGGAKADDLMGVLVPVRVGGTIDNPRYWVSLTEYVKSLGGAVIGVPLGILGGVADVITGVGSVLVPDAKKPEGQSNATQPAPAQ